MTEVIVTITDKPENVRDLVDAHLAVKRAAQEVGGTACVLSGGDDWSRRDLRVKLPEGAGVQSLTRHVIGYQANTASGSPVRVGLTPR